MCWRGLSERPPNKGRHKTASSPSSAPGKYSKELRSRPIELQNSARPIDPLHMLPGRRVVPSPAKHSLRQAKSALDRTRHPEKRREATNVQMVKGWPPRHGRLQRDRWVEWSSAQCLESNLQTTSARKVVLLPSAGLQKSRCHGDGFDMPSRLQLTPGSFRKMLRSLFEESEYAEQNRTRNNSSKCEHNSTAASQQQR